MEVSDWDCHVFVAIHTFTRLITMACGYDIHIGSVSNYYKVNTFSHCSK